ncbi:hypothetical protein [Leptothrix ochracea]|uniref:hypothetical protein n=1 Tax=Leptothrix ochracea TaxID=735331 RepID=UPI0034E2B423
MESFIGAIADLFSVIAAAAFYRDRSRQPVFVATWVASLGFALFGVVYGGLFMAFMEPAHPVLSFGVAGLVLLTFFAIASRFGVNPGFSLSRMAISSYALSFFLGTASLGLLFPTLHVT